MTPVHCQVAFLPSTRDGRVNFGTKGFRHYSVPIIVFGHLLGHFYDSLVNNCVAIFLKSLGNLGSWSYRIAFS